MKVQLATGKVVGLWVATAAILGLAALAGNLFLAGASNSVLSIIRALAAGAVIASLATEVFPQAFREGRFEVGIATALGLVAAFALL